ncbi:hypothetical protein REPUB_Repub07fG0149800 [Reevesia pubescens]
MGAEQALKRIPRIKFPQRHPKPSASGSISETQATRKDGDIISSFIKRSSSDVPAPPINTAVGGKASLLPKRTPVSEKEIEAILVASPSDFTIASSEKGRAKKNTTSVDSHAPMETRCFCEGENISKCF